MAEIIGVSAWTAAGIIWGDWRNWRRYHATILIFILFDYFYYYLSYNYRLWTLIPTAPLRSEFAALLGEAVVFASTILIFLGHYPDKRSAAFKWLLWWVCLYSANEYVLLLTGTFSYSHGWSLLDSAVFNVMMFPMLRLHHTRPLLAYLLIIPIMILYIWYYRIPIH